MAIDVKELIRWATTLDPQSEVAIDEGGLALVELTNTGLPTNAYLEVGGIPEDEDEDEEELCECGREKHLCKMFDDPEAEHGDA